MHIVHHSQCDFFYVIIVTNIVIIIVIYVMPMQKGDQSFKWHQIYVSQWYLSMRNLKIFTYEQEKGDDDDDGDDEDDDVDNNGDLLVGWKDSHQ